MQHSVLTHNMTRLFIELQKCFFKKSYQLSTVFSLLGGRWAGEAEPVGLRSALAEWAGEALELAGGWTMPARNKILKKH